MPFMKLNPYVCIKADVFCCRDWAPYGDAITEDRRRHARRISALPQIQFVVAVSEGFKLYVSLLKRK